MNRRSAIKLLAASERKAARYTAEDFRFTAKGQTIYAMCMAQPQQSVTIKSLAEGKVSSVRLVGGGPLKFEQGSAGLKIEVPERRPGEHTLAFGIES